MTASPVFIGEKPDGVSPSRISQFNRCPRQYKFVSIERLPEKKSIAAYRGTIFHYVMELLYSCAATPEDRTVENAMLLLRAVYPEMMNAEHTEELGMDESARQKYAAEIAALIRKYFTMENPQTIECIATEQRLDLDMGGFGLRGIIDRMDRENGELVIVDYKTGAAPRKREWEHSAFAAMRVYAYLVEKVVGERPTKLRLLYVKSGKVLERAVTQKVVDEAEQWVHNTWSDIEVAYDTNDFPARPTVLCGWCAFKSLCDAEQYATY
jgi:putative RecB family exonuclease